MEKDTSRWKAAQIEAAHLTCMVLGVNVYDGSVGSHMAGHFPAQGVDDVAGVRDCHGGLAGLPIGRADHGGSYDEGEKGDDGGGRGHR